MFRPTLRVSRALSSHAYLPPTPKGPPTAPGAPAGGAALPISPQPEQHPGTTSSPSLTPEQRRLLEEIVRVDHAGELGANWIYRGQKWGSAVRGDGKTVGQVEHNVRPTALYPVWQGLAWGMGAVTALMGKEAAMACTEAVETVIGEHYDDQLRDLKPVLEENAKKANPDPSLPLLANILEEFRDDELEHLDFAVEEGALKAPGHSLLSAAIGAACKIGITVAQKV
ncbi:ubiquinone metabolism-related protein [Trichosporon asahii var. asahii CBS 2479]|uniref:5-demethoxyubiquinone hydroxylase, mitochondrial n=1 Tax=Trichosporon asahii var. asahii (strain ATCC 90039 / CBS 2479 / JCM 2466 / KCTC 7840 / NBRC 103889/ NCYC 2677 / UAMH 7654) TaxID=1186058 RepID=J6F3W2_TRIAS|nr:ubiquinone metabolism-related protein [Trichosporon asahii var. asahii CBS 2479]EJT49927.1 ubiquinone metabolism-related protein [Trichosporon asahii var. asahii CBS 2479]